MCLRIDIGVHPQGDTRLPAHFAGQSVQPINLVRHLDIEAANPDLQGPPHFILAFADTREHDLARIAARG